MGRIVVNTNVTLDGVVEDPTGEEAFRAGGWFLQISETDREAWAKREFEEALKTDAVLLGKRTDVWFGTRWNARDGEWAERLNALPKYVVSSTPAPTVWENGTVLNGDVVTEVTRLKQEVDGQIAVYGSRQLVHTLLEHGLVDELRLFVYPSVLGSGGRLFGDLSVPSALRLRTAEVVGDNIVYVEYEVIAA